MTKITKATVKKLADLAMLDLSESELEKFSEQIGDILEYVEKLNELDTGDAEFTSHVDFENVMEDDQPVAALDPKDAVSQSNHTQGTYLVVPAVIE